MADGMDWEEQDAEVWDADLDHRLRLELERSLPLDERVEDVLAGLAPAIARARRNRLLGQVATGVVASVLMVAGIGVALRALPGADRTVTVAGDPEVTMADGGLLTPAEDEDGTRGTIEVTGTSVPAGSTTPPVSTSESNDPSITSSADGAETGTTGDETSATGADQPTLGPSTTAPSDVTSVPESVVATPPPATTSTAPTSTSSTSAPESALPPGTSVQSQCGSIRVSVSGDDVTLIKVNPKTGFSADVKSEGPESVEVSFASRTAQCELKAKVEHGELEIERED